MDNSSSSSHRDPVERLAEEFLDRRRRGEPASIDDYADRFPQWADRIREFFPALEVMEGFKPRSGDRTGSAAGSADADGPRLERLGEYRILREIGRGGMGVVYEAIQESMGRRVALKILPLHGRIDAVLRERFRLESRSAGRLQHAGIVPVYGVGEHGGVHYYVMQYIAGHGLDVILDDLRRLKDRAAAVPPSVGAEKDGTASMAVARSLLTGRFAGSRSGRDGEAAATTSPEDEGGPLPDDADRPTAGAGIRSVLSQPTESGYYRAVARLGVQVAEALAHAHWQGVLHRDIKPSNLLLDADGHASVTDFGLAKLEGSDGPTQTGDIVGTLRYMAPERFEGWSDRRSDLYGLGVTLYELLTLRPAFDAATRARMIDQVVHDPPPAPRKYDPRIPRDLETIVLKAMAKEPGERYATAEALASDLENYLADRPIVARRSGLPERAWRWCRRNPAAAGLLAASAVAAMALVGLGVGSFYHSQLRRAFGEMDRALRSEQIAHENEITARKNEESIRYFNNMLMAEREWSASNVGRSEQLLDECVPKPERSDDLRGWEWNYLKRQCHTDSMTLLGPASQLNGVAFSPDGRRIASAGCFDKAIRVWDTKTGEVIYTLGPHSQNIYNVAFSPDGKLIASCSGHYHEPGEVKLWDAASGLERKSFTGATGASSNLAFSPDGRRLAAVSGEWAKAPLVTIWDVHTLKEVRKIPGAEGEMAWIDLAFSPDGNHLATAGGILDFTSTVTGPGEVKVHDTRTGESARPVGRHEKPLTSVAYSPDGQWLATTSWDNTAKIWDLATGKAVFTLDGHTQLVKKAVFSFDSRRLATTSEDASVKIWDVRTGRELFTLRGHTLEVRGAAFSHDGRWLATASQDQTVKIWDIGSGKEALTLGGHTDSVNGVAFAPNGRQVASASWDNTAMVWDLSEERRFRVFPRTTEPLWDVAYRPDGAWIATAGGNWTHPETLGQITLWDAGTGVVIRTLEAHAGVVRAVAFSPDGKRLASAGDEAKRPGEVKVWSLETGQEVFTLRGHTAGLSTVAYSPDGRFLVSAGFDYTVRVWGADTRRLIHILTGHAEFVTGVSFSRPDGNRIASASADGTVRIWDVVTGNEVAQLLGHKAGVLCVTYSPDGNRIASGGDDHTVKIWDVKTGREALTLRGHTDTIWRVTFSPDGNLIASASRDGTVKIWDGTPWVEPAIRNVQVSRVRGSP